MPAVFCHSDHLAHLNLLQVEREPMSEARLRVVELERQFVELEPPIGRIWPATVAQLLHLRRLQRLKTLRHFERLLESLLLINPGNRSGHRQAHRISKGFLTCEHAFLHWRAVAANGLHPERGDSPAI